MSKNESTRASQSTGGNNETPVRRARRWCFTCNNYNDEQLRAIREQGAKNKFMVFGFEVGEQGTPHIQGYCEFKNDTSLGHLRKTWPSGIHWAIAKGTKQQNIDYCTKEGQHETSEKLPLTEAQVREKVRLSEIEREKKQEEEFRFRIRQHEKYKDGFPWGGDWYDYQDYIKHREEQHERLQRLFGNYL